MYSPIIEHVKAGKFKTSSSLPKGVKVVLKEPFKFYIFNTYLHILMNTIIQKHTENQLEPQHT